MGSVRPPITRKRDQALEQEHEVKGLWFVVARKYLLERYGAEAIDAIAAAMSPEHRPVFLEPSSSAWYPEAALQQSLGAFRERIARRDDKVFVEALEACTVEGVHRFFQILIGLTSPAFILRRCPVLWHFVQRGPSRVMVDADDRRAHLYYHDFPYFDDVSYRLLVEANIRAVAGLAQPRRPPVVKIVGWDRSSLDVEVVYG